MENISSTGPKLPAPARRHGTPQWFWLFMGAALTLGCKKGEASSVAAPVAVASVPPSPSVALRGVDLSPTPPPDSPAPPSPIPPTFQSTMNDYAWRLFVAMSWPADSSQRGQPDTKARFGDPGMPVWATFKDVNEVFLPDGQRPRDWNEWPATPAACTSLVRGHARRLSQTSKVSQVLQAAVEAVGGSLTDQHGMLARYAESMNQTEFAYTVANQYYDARVQWQLRQALSLPFDSIEVKTAWRQWTADDQKDPSRAERYYLEDFCVCDGTPAQPTECHPATMALTGVHLTRKTPNAPQWTFATFEQVDNLTASGGSYNNPACNGQYCQCNMATKSGRPGSVPTQVCRQTTLPDDVTGSNALWQRKIATYNPKAVWQFYQLIGIQYPTKPGNSLGDPEPNVLANVVIETYNQLTSSCNHCHSSAGTAVPKTPPFDVQHSDFSYLFAHATPSPTVKK